MNCRNYEYYTVCDVSMCCSMDLSMYSNVYEDCVVNPSRDIQFNSIQFNLFQESTYTNLIKYKIE